MSETKLFKVRPGRGISSKKHGRDFFEGEIVDLSHAHAQEISALIDSGAIEEYFGDGDVPEEAAPVSQDLPIEEPDPDEPSEAKSKKKKVNDG